MNLLDLVLLFFLVVVGVSLLRVVWGPSTVDRMIGLNMMGSIILAMLVLFAVKEQRAIYLDVALVYGIFGFIGLLAITRYFAGRSGS